MISVHLQNEFLFKKKKSLNLKCKYVYQTVIYFEISKIKYFLPVTFSTNTVKLSIISRVLKSTKKNWIQVKIDGRCRNLVFEMSTTSEIGNKWPFSALLLVAGNNPSFRTFSEILHGWHIGRTHFQYPVLIRATEK